MWKGFNKYILGPWLVMYPFKCLRLNYWFENFDNLKDWICQVSFEVDDLFTRCIILAICPLSWLSNSYENSCFLCDPSLHVRLYFFIVMQYALFSDFYDCCFILQWLYFPLQHGHWNIPYHLHLGFIAYSNETTYPLNQPYYDFSSLVGLSLLSIN